MIDPRAELANNHVQQFDCFESTNDSYSTWGPWNFDARARKTAQNYENYRNNWDDDDEGVQFRPLNTEDGQSGVHSPPLWTTSPPRSPVHPRHHVNNYRSLSPASRTQAIARGQRELMEMVKNMPESCYELSLKDLVEQPRVETQEECLLQEKNYDDHQQVVAHQRVNIKRQESNNNEKKSKIVRSGSMDNRGLFLKMVFPISFKSNKKNNVNTSSTSAKVSPKPEICDRTSKSVDKDWWKKRFSASSESDSSGRSSSNNSGSTGSSGSSRGSSGSSIRKKSGFFSSCLPCFHFTKGKSAE